MENCFVYIRKSTNDDKKQVNSLDMQINWINKFLSKNLDYQIIGLDGKVANPWAKGFIIEEKSAKQGGKTRPEFTKMIEAINKYSCDYLVVRNPNRISRNSNDTLTFMSLIEKKDKKIKKGIITKNRIYDVNNSRDIIDFEISLTNAKVENSNRSETAKDSYEYKRGNGIYSHKFPFGYINDGNNKVSIDEKKKQLVEMAFNLRLKGYGWKYIADIFNKEGENVDGDKISDIVSNIVYTGMYYFENEAVEIINEGYTSFVSKEIYDKVQEYNIKNKKKRSSSNEVDININEEQILFKKIVFDLYGNSLQGYIQKKNGAVYYRNNTKKYNYIVNISQEKFFQKMNTEILKYRFSDKLLLIIKQTLLLKLKNVDIEKISKIKEIESRIYLLNENIDKQMSEIIKYTDERAKENLRRKISEMYDEIDKLQLEKQNIEKKVVSSEDVANKYIKYFENLPETYKKLNKKEKANIIHGLGINFFVGPDKTIIIKGGDIGNLLKNNF